MDEKVRDIKHIENEKGILLYLEIDDGMIHCFPVVYHVSIFAGQILYLDVQAQKFEAEIRAYAEKYKLL